MDGEAENKPHEDKPQRDEAWRVLSNAQQVRLGEDQRYWSVFSIFWAANVLLLYTLFSSDNLRKPSVVLIIILTGLLGSSVWAFVVSRTLVQIEDRERIISGVEDFLGLGDNATMFGRQAGKKNDHLFPRCFTWVVFSLWLAGVLWPIHLWEGKRLEPNRAIASKDKTDEQIVSIRIRVEDIYKRLDTRTQDLTETVRAISEQDKELSTNISKIQARLDMIEKGRANQKNSVRKFRSLRR